MGEPEDRKKKPRVKTISRTVDLHERLYERVQDLAPYMANDPELLAYFSSPKVSTAAILRILVLHGLRQFESRYGIVPRESTSLGDDVAD